MMFKNLVKYTAIIFIVLFFISIVTIVYAYTNKDDSGKIYEKIDAELSYIDKEVIKLMKTLNNLNQEKLTTSNVSIDSNQQQDISSANNQSNENNELSNELNQETNVDIFTKSNESILTTDRNDIDWLYLQREIEKLSTSCAVITIDLTSININSDNILALSSNIDDCIKYCKDNDKQNLLISLVKIYNLLPEYKKDYSQDSTDIELLYIKSDILLSYALLETQNWDNVYEILVDADSRMYGLINSDEYIKNKSQSMEKNYVLLKEYIKSANDQDIDLCYMKFYYLIEEMDH